MPKGKGTYGNKKGRPPKTSKSKSGSKNDTFKRLTKRK